MYADDTSISFSSNSIPDVNQKVISDLLCFKTWMESNKLSLNVTKTQTILIGGREKLKDIEYSGPQNLQIAIDQEPASKIKYFRYLGIEVDQFLSWEGYISALIKTISSGIGMLRHGKRYFPLTTVRSMYKSIIEPHFRFYCSFVGSLQCYCFEYTTETAKPRC